MCFRSSRLTTETKSEEQEALRRTLRAFFLEAAPVRVR
jgi:hypothetical protein